MKLENVEKTITICHLYTTYMSTHIAIVLLLSFVIKIKKTILISIILILFSMLKRTQ